MNYVSTERTVRCLARTPSLSFLQPHRAHEFCTAAHRRLGPRPVGPGHRATRDFGLWTLELAPLPSDWRPAVRCSSDSSGRRRKGWDRGWSCSSRSGGTVIGRSFDPGVGGPSRGPSSCGAAGVGFAGAAGEAGVCVSAGAEAGCVFKRTGDQVFFVPPARLPVIAHIEHGYSLREIVTHLGCSVDDPSTDASTPVATGDGVRRHWPRVQRRRPVPRSSRRPGSRGKMARVTEADDLAVVEVVVLAEQCDASGGGPEVDVTE